MNITQTMKKTFILFSLTFLILKFESIAQEVRVYKAPKFQADWINPGIHPDRIVLNPGPDPTRQMAVTWRTSPEVTVAYAEIAPATAAPKFWRNGKTLLAKTTILDGTEIANAGLISANHSVKFAGLEPNTIYGYRVGDGEHWSEWFQFKTASDDKSAPFSFLYVGDAQNYVLELWSRLIREGYRQAPNADFIIHAGDLINTAHREQDWHEWFTAGGFIHSMLPTIAVPGNHEYNYLSEAKRDEGRQLSAQWKPQFTLPENGPEGLEETAYFIDYPDVKMIFLDSNRDHEKQSEWLRKILAENDKKWTIVSYHHPLFSASAGRDNDELRAIWKPIFDEYKVDLALQGHDHSYARGRANPGENDNVMDGMNMRDQTGTVYVVSVSGGKMYGLNPNGWEGTEAIRDRAAENTQLVQVISIEDNTLKFESFTAIGELYDAFVLEKQSNGINKFTELKQDLGPEYRFNNTIPYEDPLPEELRRKIEGDFPGFEVTRVNYRENKGMISIAIRIEKGEEEKNFIIDQKGNILSEN